MIAAEMENVIKVITNVTAIKNFGETIAAKKFAQKNVQYKIK